MKEVTALLSDRAASLRRLGVNPDRVKQLVIGCIKRQGDLADCDPESVFMAIIHALECGLEPGPMREAFLVPFKRRATLVIGYRGYVKLMYRSGTVRSINCWPVFEDDQEFRVEYGTDAKIVHVPNILTGQRDPTKLVATYAVIESIYGGRTMDVMPLTEIRSVQDRSASKDKGPWVTDFVEMARKSVLRRASKLIPQSVELARATELDVAYETQNLEALDLEIEAPPKRLGVSAVKQKLGVAVTPENVEAVMQEAKEKGNETTGS